ncbi:hypothetical protein MKW98_028428 [Papaver atlanticum]|uniref:Uncharacterized protein n=1 Tax=Papaver atlanticum TaxID=357466 RepID=A0AAD4XMJ3_9MAGN|nr:hypothetical protein MKW98_028428 [Papaver atlanticum]
MAMGLNEFRPIHFPAFGEWDYYCYQPNYYYTTSSTNGGNDHHGHHQQQDLYGVDTDLYRGGGAEEVKIPVVVVPTTTTNVVNFSPKKENKLYAADEGDETKDRWWIYGWKASPTKYNNPQYRTTTAVAITHKPVDEDLYKIPSPQLRRAKAPKVKVLGFISRCFSPSCVM